LAIADAAEPAHGCGRKALIREIPARVPSQGEVGESNMIGMNFISFLILLVISVAVSAILHYGLNYYVTPGVWSFCSKLVVGWIGAWLGSPVFGYWPHEFPLLGYGNVWFIPAILGSLAALVLAIDLVKMRRGAA
jgi:uncharacterized membrane protein YeaQ/YmgE (transglycosylase-associated protein family)